MYAAHVKLARSLMATRFGTNWTLIFFWIDGLRWAEMGVLLQQMFKFPQQHYYQGLHAI